MVFLALCLVACSDEEFMDEVEAQPEEEIVKEATSNRDAQQELNWILENNDSLHSPSDQLARFVDYNTGDPIGTSIYYDFRDGIDNQRYRMNIKIDKIQGQFVLGWNAPNLHDIYLDNTTPVQSESESRPIFIETSDLMYETLYDLTGSGWLKSGAFVQMTAADVDSDNELEFIIYGIAPNPNTGWNDFVLEVYEYYPNQQQPFERVVQIADEVFSALPIKVTPAGEFIIDFYRGEEYVVALCKDGEWYVPEQYYHESAKQSANYLPLTSDYDYDYANAIRSKQNVLRVECRKKKCEEQNIPSVQDNESLMPQGAKNNESQATENTVEKEPVKGIQTVDGIVVDSTNDTLEILKYYGTEELATYIQDYVRESVEAKNTGDFDSIVAYLDEGSPVYKDMIKSVPATYKKGIKIETFGTDVEKIVIEDEYIYFTVVNTFNILNSTYDGPVNFRSTYKVFMGVDYMKVNELVSDTLLD